MNKNKNKNIKSSQKEENVNVRRVRQLDETNATKNNKKEKQSVVSRRARMLDFSQLYKNITNFSTSVVNYTNQVLQTIPTGGIYNKDVTFNLSSYPDYFEVSSYNDHVYAIKIKKEFEYEHPIKLTYKEIKVFTSKSTTKDSTTFTNSRVNYSSFKESKNKYINDIANGKPWSAWYGADPVSKEEITLDWDGVDSDLYDKKVSSADGSLFTWEGKFVLKIDMNWNTTLSFRTEDGWLPDNKQWIYGNLRIFRRELATTKTNVERLTYYEPPNVDGLQNEAVYRDEYNTTLYVIRRIPRVYKFERYVPSTGKIGQIGADSPEGKYWYNRGLPYYYGTVTDYPTRFNNYCTNNNGKGTNESCLQGMARYVYISTKSNYNISDGTIYVSKSGAVNSIVEFNSHLVGYYEGRKQSDQDIKVQFKFNYVPEPQQTLLETKIVVCDPSTYNNPDNSTPTEYKIYYPPKPLAFEEKRAIRVYSVGGDVVKYETNLSKLIVNDTSINDAYVNRENLMSIITNSTGPISFQLDNQYIYPEETPFPFAEVKTYTFLGDTYLSINANLNRAGFGMGYISEGSILGKFRLNIIQEATSTYAKKVITLEFDWSIYSGSNFFTYFISFKRRWIPFIVVG